MTKPKVFSSRTNREAPRPARDDKAARACARSLRNPLWCYHGFNGAVAVLTVFGLIMVFSSSSVSMISAGASPWRQAMMQSLYALVGLGVAIAAMLIRADWYKRRAFILLIAADILQFLTLTPAGVEVYGNRGWIGVGNFTVQPAEIVKLVLCIWIPSSMERSRKRFAKARGFQEQVKAYLPTIGSYLASLALVLAGKDLGTGLIILCIGITGFALCGFPLKWLACAAALALVLVSAMLLTSTNRMNRLFAAYGECTDLEGVCYQSMHAKYALASGGLLGVGMGNSREKWNYLPAAHNDFIYAIIGEETGFVGAALVIILFVVIGWCLLTLARQMTNTYAASTLVCYTVWLVGQALCNIAVVLGLFPVIGVPMPFVSAGGSSLIMCLAAAGICDSMMRTQPQVHAERTHA